MRDRFSKAGSLGRSACFLCVLSLAMRCTIDREVGNLKDATSEAPFFDASSTDADVAPPEPTDPPTVIDPEAGVPIDIPDGPVEMQISFTPKEIATQPLPYLASANDFVDGAPVMWLASATAASDTQKPWVVSIDEIDHRLYATRVGSVFLRRHLLSTPGATYRDAVIATTRLGAPLILASRQDVPALESFIFDASGWKRAHITDDIGAVGMATAEDATGNVWVFFASKDGSELRSLVFDGSVWSGFAMKPLAIDGRLKAAASPDGSVWVSGRDAASQYMVAGQLRLKSQRWFKIAAATSGDHTALLATDTDGVEVFYADMLSQTISRWRFENNGWKDLKLGIDVKISPHFGVFRAPGSSVVVGCLVGEARVQRWEILDTGRIVPSEEPIFEPCDAIAFVPQVSSYHALLMGKSRRTLYLRRGTSDLLSAQSVSRHASMNAHIKLASDENNTPSLLYFDSTYRRYHHAEWKDAAWEMSTIDVDITALGDSAALITSQAQGTWVALTGNTGGDTQVRGLYRKRTDGWQRAVMLENMRGPSFAWHWTGDPLLQSATDSITNYNTLTQSQLVGDNMEWETKVHMYYQTPDEDVFPTQTAGLSWEPFYFVAHTFNWAGRGMVALYTSWGRSSWNAMGNMTYQEDVQPFGSLSMALIDPPEQSRQFFVHVVFSDFKSHSLQMRTMNWLADDAVPTHSTIAQSDTQSEWYGVATVDPSNTLTVAYYDEASRTPQVAQPQGGSWKAVPLSDPFSREFGRSLDFGIDGAARAHAAYVDDTDGREVVRYHTWDWKVPSAAVTGAMVAP